LSTHNVKGAPKGVYYGAYLQLDALLGAQRPESAAAGKPAHDEMLFIIVHQAYELWFKQILHELERICGDFDTPALDDTRLLRIVNGLNRIHEIEKLLLQQIDVLETMSPADFMEFRDYLVPASGFQSLQFRMIEMRLGLTERERHEFGDRKFHERLSDADRAALLAVSEKPSLLHLLDGWLARTPFLSDGAYAFREDYRAAVLEMLRREKVAVAQDAVLSEPVREGEAKALDAELARFQALFAEDGAESGWRMSLGAVQAALFITVYRDQPVLQLPYRLLAALMDIDQSFALWRHRHALMVERMIGVRTGTGGSSGHDYLRQTAVSHRVFSDLFRLSTFLIPRADLPPLPATLAARMGFAYAADMVPEGGAR